MLNAASDVTTLLREVTNGNREAEARLYELIYGELRKRAGALFLGQRDGRMETPTAIVHEAYLRLLKPNDHSWHSRQDFYRYASRVMRNILVDAAREALAEKRGGGHVRPLDDEDRLPDRRSTSWAEMIDLDVALGELQKLNSRHSDIVTMRYFGGLTAEEVADVLGTSKSTVDREWRAARAWLLKRLR